MENLVGFEFSSPIFRAQDALWFEQIDNISLSLPDYFQIVPSERCGTHIHIKPEGGKWKLPCPQETCQGHHRFCTSHPSRQSNEFSANNRRGQHVDKDMSGEGLQLVLDRIERKRKTKTLVEYMCPGPESEPAERNY